MTTSTRNQYNNIFKSPLQFHFAHTPVIVTPLWFELLLELLPLFNTLNTKADVIGTDSSLFSAVKQRKGTAPFCLWSSEGNWTDKKINCTSQPEDRSKMLCSTSQQSCGQYFFFYIFLCVMCPLIFLHSNKGASPSSVEIRKSARICVPGISFLFQAENMNAFI